MSSYIYPIEILILHLKELKNNLKSDDIATERYNELKIKQTKEAIKLLQCKELSLVDY